ncbi:regulator of chromosome condensation 1/beta-lactamase-inhibitor protein II [Tirmania nivea]|nr:regulator of chromosome condensation 1/beta-lactamase-inhibitor protein II [Tirmania nivea]
MASITALPSDIIIDNIIPLLSVKEFLNLCATCKAFLSFADDEVYWRKLTKITFRLPAQPLREKGWRELYKNLHRATLYTWGSNEKGRLGHRHDCRIVHSPLEVDLPTNQVAVDVVMGGWSTTVLTAFGSLYTWGSLSGFSRPHLPDSTSDGRATKLEFPAAHTSTNIVEVSSGRSHVLGLSEEGRIWSWTREDLPGTFIKFIHVDTRTYGSTFYGTRRARGTVERVAAGWNHSAALVNGVGIVVWFPSSEGTVDEEGVLVDGELVPGTCYIEGTPKPSTISDEDWNYSKEVGEVICIMAGDSYLVFLTKPGKVYAVWAQPNMVAGTRPVQLYHFSAPAGEKPMTYISGSFCKFAVFNSDGLVYIGTKDQVQEILDASVERPSPELEEIQSKPTVIPRLQKCGIVAIAFGDYHSLALTAEGKVLSWGTEPEMCGCLGHGPVEIARRKGVKFTAYGQLDEPTEVKFDRLETSKSQKPKDNQYFIFYISAAGWHSGALALAPSRDWRDSTRLERLNAVDSATPIEFLPRRELFGHTPGPTQPHQPHLPCHLRPIAPGRIGRPGAPPGEMGHGRRVRPGEESTVQRGHAIPDIISSNPTPFISHGPVRPAPGAFPNPTPMVGVTLVMGEEDIQREEEKQEGSENQGNGGQEQDGNAQNSGSGGRTDAWFSAS